jgi:hypothetical protein
MLSEGSDENKDAESEHKTSIDTISIILNDDFGIS